MSMLIEFVPENCCSFIHVGVAFVISYFDAIPWLIGRGTEEDDTVRGGLLRMNMSGGA